jgi:hypothetical protein
MGICLGPQCWSELFGPEDSLASDDYGTPPPWPQTHTLIAIATDLSRIRKPERLLKFAKEDLCMGYFLAVNCMDKFTCDFFVYELRCAVATPITILLILLEVYISSASVCDETEVKS